MKRFRQSAINSKANELTVYPIAMAKNTINILICGVNWVLKNCSIRNDCNAKTYVNEHKMTNDSNNSIYSIVLHKEPPFSNVGTFYHKIIKPIINPLEMPKFDTIY